MSAAASHDIGDNTGTGPQGGQATPERILQMAWAYAVPLSISAAVSNGLFNALDTAPRNATELSEELHLSERGVTAVANALVGFGLLSKDSAGRYRLAPDTASFLVRGKPAFLGGLFEHMQASIIPNWLHLAESMRTGEPSAQFNLTEEGSPFFAAFVEALFPMNYPAAQALAHAVAANLPGHGAKVLDLAAGSGVWGIALAQANPDLHVTAVDFAPVLETTRATVTRFGLEDRFTYVDGDIHGTPLGQDYDVALLGHILHSEGVKRSQQILRSVFTALKPGGVVVIAEFLVNAERTGPPGGLIFSENMLIHSTSGDAYSFDEIQSWLTDAGFRKIRSLDVPAPSPLILAERP